MPFASHDFSGAFITLYLTVDICGLLLGQTICAIILPPKAGLICTRSVFSFILSIVQSAVSPVLNLAATLGASDLPIVVAPTSMDDGFTLFTKSSNAAVYGSILKSLSSSQSYTKTSSTP